MQTIHTNNSHAQSQIDFTRSSFASLAPIIYGRGIVLVSTASAFAWVALCSSGVATSASGMGVSPGTESCIMHMKIVPKQNLMIIGINVRTIISKTDYHSWARSWGRTVA